MNHNQGIVGLVEDLGWLSALDTGDLALAAVEFGLPSGEQGNWPEHPARPLNGILVQGLHLDYLPNSVENVFKSAGWQSGKSGDRPRTCRAGRCAAPAHLWAIGQIWARL